MDEASLTEKLKNSRMSGNRERERQEDRGIDGWME